MLKALLQVKGIVANSNGTARLSVGRRGYDSERNIVYGVRASFGYLWCEAHRATRERVSILLARRRGLDQTVERQR